MEQTLIMGRVRNKLNDKVRIVINHRNRKRLKNHDFSLLANNCNGGFILHDLGMRFNSPFVNLWMRPDEYIKMLSDLKGYLSEELSFIKEDNIDYPVGFLRDARIYFEHYNSEKEAKEKWDERKKRLNYDNLFVLLVDKDGCNNSDLKQFERLPYRNKVIFSNRPHQELRNAFYIKGFENQESIGDCFSFVPNMIGRKYYDQFDYVEWFNHA